jgi:hypothetical protein
VESNKGFKRNEVTHNKPQGNQNIKKSGILTINVKNILKEVGYLTNFRLLPFYFPLL